VSRDRRRRRPILANAVLAETLPVLEYCQKVQVPHAAGTYAVGELT
jgi:hypothetical protein